MRSVIFIILFLLLQATATTQPCLPEGITFTTQAQIDSFQINYPGCTEIEGNVWISGVDITNLNGLSVLTSIEGYLEIIDNDTLVTLNGLENLVSIGAGLRIGFYDWGYGTNLSLTSIASLSNLSSIGSWLSVAANPNLTSLTGLEGLTTLQDLTVHLNNSLVSLQGLENITHIQGELDIADNASLASLTELENLVSIDGILYIAGNVLINSLTGLHNIDAGSISHLFIGGNEALSTCEVQSICDYLASPNGNIYISNNAPGCNSPEEVDSACAYLSVPLVVLDDIYDVSPNPFTTSTTIEYELTESSNVQLTIYNTIGETIHIAVDRMMLQGKHSFTWTADRLPEGLYYGVLRSEEGVSVVKMVKQ